MRPEPAELPDLRKLEAVESLWGTGFNRSAVVAGSAATSGFVSGITPPFLSRSFDTHAHIVFTHEDDNPRKQQIAVANTNKGA